MPLELEAEPSGTLGTDRRRVPVEVSIRSEEKAEASTRNVVLCVDTSTSMGVMSNKIENARKGVEGVLDLLNPEDRVSIIGFDTNTDVVLPLTKWADADEAAVRRDVSGSGGSDYDGELEANGGTDIVGALQRAQRQLNENTTGSRLKEIVLLSDGRDGHSADRHGSLAEDISDDGITIHAGGLGSNYDEDVMLALGRRSGGESYNLQDADAVGTFLPSRVEESGQVVAPDPELHIDTADEFIVDPEEPATIEKPQTQSKPVQSEGETDVIDLPQLRGGSLCRLSFVVIGSPQPTGIAYHCADLSVEDNGTLATTSFDIEYQDEESGKVEVDKRRRKSVITDKITDPDVSKEEIEDDIEEVEKEGWTEMADDLREKLGAESKIEVTRDDEEDEEDEN